ncbi:MAG: BlaI/MecI/CopY family transcriptional regulator [Oscillospiraceae bacterium]|nr:BlaI/MecI/CopY family transcriptional regulator [Oscillospiraceae bacterium]
MDVLRLYDGEYKFVSIIWNTEPIRSGKLVRLCSEQLGWKKSTTYTMLKKLCQKGVLQNKDSVVTALMTQEDVQRQESCAVMERTFHGSLPKFLTAFLQDRTLTEKEAEELKALIDRHRKDISS